MSESAGIPSAYQYDARASGLAAAVDPRGLRANMTYDTGASAAPPAPGCPPPATPLLEPGPAPSAYQYDGGAAWRPAAWPPHLALQAAAAPAAPDVDEPVVVPRRPDERG